MAKQRINIAVNLDPENPTAGDLGGAYVPGATNLLFEKYTDGRTYAQTRPAVLVAARRPDGVTEGKGRGIFYWESAEKLLTVYDDKIHSGIYAAEEQVISPGRDPVYWAEFSSTELIMTDPENNEVWYITHDGGGNITVQDWTATVQADLINEGIAGGVVVLDSYCFIMSKAGKIYNSDVGTVQTWNALNFLTTERAVDPGVYIAKQNEHIIAISSSSTEIFYDAANPIGSPLKRRSDISYLVGSDDYKHCSTNGTKLFFVAATSQGSFGVYKIENLKLIPVSHQTIDSWINNNLVSFQRSYFLTCATLGEHFAVYLTSVRSVGDTWQPINTALYDDSTQIWSRFETGAVLNEIPDKSFPIYAIAERTGSASFGQSFILHDGSICAYSLENTGTDIFQTDPYITESGGNNDPDEYWEPGYVVKEAGEETWNINPYIVTEEWDGNSSNNKFMSKMSVIGRIRDRTVDKSSRLEFSYSDDVIRTWAPLRSIDATTHWRWTRLGHFQRRTFYVRYVGEDRIRIEALEVDVTGAEYA